MRRGGHMGNGGHNSFTVLSLLYNNLRLEYKRMGRRALGRPFGREKPMIEVTDLTKKYGNHTAVEHLSFRVEKGQIYGFLGPNGAGKSTTMNILTGYLAASSGTVTVDGKDILKEPEEAKKRIGYLPEVPPLYMDMTVEEYLRFVTQLKKVPAGERKKQMEEIMDRTGIRDMRKRLIKNLSKGYRQRVGLAQALVGYPEVIILDEPSVGLDPKQIIEMRDLIRSLGKNHTVILSSHILSEVSAVCDHVMIISRGRLAASGTPRELEERMRGKGELQLTVKGEEAPVRKALEGLEGISKAELAPAGEKGCVKALLSLAGEEDVREQVFYRLAEERLPIMSMNLNCRTLEDIFLELTGQDAGEEEPAGKTRRGRKPQKKGAEPGEASPGKAAGESAAQGTLTGEPAGESAARETAPGEPAGESAAQGTLPEEPAGESSAAETGKEER